MPEGVVRIYVISGTLLPETSVLALIKRRGEKVVPCFDNQQTVGEALVRFFPWIHHKGRTFVISSLKYQRTFP